MSLNRRRLHFQGGKSGSRVMHPDFVTIYDVFSSRRIYYWKKKQTKNSFDRFVSVSLVNVTHANVPSFPAPAISLHAAGKFEMKKHGMDCGDIQPINIITPCTCTNSAAYSSIRQEEPGGASVSVVNVTLAYTIAYKQWPQQVQSSVLQCISVPVLLNENGHQVFLLSFSGKSIYCLIQLFYL